MLHRLADGTRVLIRPIQAEDKPRLEAGLAQLSAETIRKRFLAAKPRFSRSELRYLTEIDGYDHIAYVAVLFDRPDALVAVARCVRFRDRPDTAEMAIVVADSLQGKGLGTLLAQHLSAAAQSLGIRHFAGTLLPDNEPVLRLMLHIAREFEDDRLEHGLREVMIELADSGAHALAAAA